MLKKIFFIAMTCFISFESKPILNRNKEHATTVLIGVGALGAAVYFLNRETNSSIIARSKALIAESYELIGQVEHYFYNNGQVGQDCVAVLLENKLVNIKDKVSHLSSIVLKRHGSYIAFWNWTDSMKEVALEYKKLLKKINENLYAFSLKKSFEFIQNYQLILQNKIELFAENKTLKEILVSAKHLKKDLAEIEEKGDQIQLELAARSSSLDFFDKKAELTVSMMVSQIYFMKTVLKYSDCILSSNNLDMMIRNARKVVGIASSYPIKDFVAMLNDDIYVLQHKNISYELYVQNVVDILKNILEEIVSSVEYAQERQAYEMYMQEQRRVRAAEEQARAAQAQAHAAHMQARAAFEQAEAQHRQADAQKEQNRVQKERNRIERERNEIERNK